jgi:hypothetical protein
MRAPPSLHNLLFYSKVLFLFTTKLLFEKKGSDIQNKRVQKGYAEKNQEILPNHTIDQYLHSRYLL